MSTYQTRLLLLAHNLIVYEQTTLTGMTFPLMGDRKALAESHTYNKLCLQSSDRLPLLEYAANQQAMCMLSTEVSGGTVGYWQDCSWQQVCYRQHFVSYCSFLLRNDKFATGCR